VSSSSRASRDDNGKAIRDRFGKGGPPGWRKDGLSKVKLEPEFGKLPIERGVISMRRFGNPDSAGSQFIIALSDMKDEMEGPCPYAKPCSHSGPALNLDQILDALGTRVCAREVRVLTRPRA
jgi:cyclophilin family peptidyl-prolyl cis-trans isomerase